VSASVKLSPADSAVFETFVVPRYLSLFGDLALNMLLLSDSARIAHLFCRTGYPDRQIFEKNDSSRIVGLDPSLSALELARNKAAVLGDVPIEYRVSNGLPTELEAEAFSHAVALHPLLAPGARVQLFAEMQRLVYSGGQALIALPLKGSFQEITDLLREYSLKYEDGDFAKAVDEGMGSAPTIETLSDELESAGFDDVDVEIRHTELGFDSGRAFIEDPVTRLLILPEIRALLGVEDLGKALEYVREAVDKYWSEDKLEISLNVGCASARKY
jgi:SAM-dependent methyltransferase